MRKGKGKGSADDFKGEKRSNETHESKSDPNARLYRKGTTASELRYMGHTLTDNRHGLVVNARVTCTDGHSERDAAKIMIDDARQAEHDARSESTLGAGKGFDAQEFIEACQQMKVTPHVAQNTSGRRSAEPYTIASSVGYAISQPRRKLIDKASGGPRPLGACAKVMVRG